MRILILDGNTNQAVTCVRSLARAGHTVVVGASTGWSKAAWSRHCRGRFSYPAPDRDGAAFVRCVAEEAARAAGTLVLPMTEATTLPLSSGRDVIAQAGGVLPLPPHAVVLDAFDKRHTVGLARSLGLSVPFTVVLEDEAQARQAARAVPYPVVLKPCFSAEPSAAGGVRVTGAPAYARTPDQLLEAYRQMTRRCRTVLLQEFVPGAGAGYFALMRHGALLAEFAHRRLRDVRPTGSGSAVRESVPVSAGLRDAALAVLKALGWHGVAMVEFRVRPDGTPVFMEVNGRFWNSVALAVHAGVDFPRRLVDMAAGSGAACLEAYPSGVRCRWLLGDLRHLAEVWRGAPQGYPSRFPGRLRTLAEFLRPVPGTFHDNFQLDDPLPELGDWLDFALHRVWPALRRRDRRDLLHVQRRYSHP